MHALNHNDQSFQLTHSRGVRRSVKQNFSHGNKISTHALTWSATRIAPKCEKALRVFQLTHSRGVRQTEPIPTPETTDFNSRTHVECDPFKMVVDASAPTNFNSRTHVECDKAIKVFVFHHIISTHALTWSATCTKNSWRCQPRISTHALTWSATGCFSG